MTPHGKIERIVLDESRLAILRENIAQRLDPEDSRIVLILIQNVMQLWAMLDKKAFEVKRLVKMLFGFKSEKTAQVLAVTTPPQPDRPDTALAGDAPSPAGDPQRQTDTPDAQTGPPPPTVKPRRKGHGRMGADQYTGAQKIDHPHLTLKPKDPCPRCPGTLYPLDDAVRVCFTGQPPLQATVHRLERLRCNLCGRVFTAPAPPEAVGPKYDPQAGAAAAVFKYAAGVPFERLARLQREMGQPVPASTQFEIVNQNEKIVRPVLDEMERQAACGEQYFVDDTMARVLSLIEENKRSSSAAKTAQDDIAQTVDGENVKAAGGDNVSGAETSASASTKERTGIFTTAMVCVLGLVHIALYYTGRRHAGENVARLLRLRPHGLAPPTQMCDGAERNIPKEFQIVLANCLTHGRRQFVEIVTLFGDHCRRVLDDLARVYKHDQECRDQGLDPLARLDFHRTHSAPVMQSLHDWLQDELDQKRVEENSSLGKAIKYMLKRWEPLTLFLRHAGAPLDNNICERAIKLAILNRKNAFFYKTERGAKVGDAYMSLIHTCRLNGVNPFDYLTQLLSHPKEIEQAPADWLPWTYQETLAAMQKRNVA